MGTAMLVAMLVADAAMPAGGGHAARHALSHSYPIARIAALPAAAIAPWSARRCRGGFDAEGTATAIDTDCIRSMMRERVAARDNRSGPIVAPRRAPAGSASGGWQLASAMLPALQGLFARGGMGIGLGSELALVRGARFTWHMAAPRDTQIAATMFAPETTVMARCGACWNESEVAGAGLTAVRRTAAAAIESVARTGVPAG